MMGQQPDGIGAGAEEGGMAQRDNSGIAEREIEREANRIAISTSHAEPEVIGEGKIEGQRQDPRQRLPPAQR